MGELVLHDDAGEFLLVHGSDEYLSLARKPLVSGEVPLVRFSPEHGPVVATAMEAVLFDPDAGVVSVSVGSDQLEVAMTRSAGGSRVRVANRSRRLRDSPEPEALLLDKRVASDMADALRGPRLLPLTRSPRRAVLHDADGNIAGIEAHEGVTTVSSRTNRAWARAAFPASLRRLVVACLAMVAANPGEASIRVAHIARGGDQVLLERVATATGGFPYTLANARPGRPARPRRTVRLSHEMAAFVIRALARDEDAPSLDASPESETEDGRVDVDVQSITQHVEVARDDGIDGDAGPHAGGAAGVGA